MNQHFKWAVILLFPIFLYLARFIVDWQYFLHRPLISAGQPSITYTLKPGAKPYDLATDLYRMGLTSHPRYVTLLARLEGTTHRFYAGEYRIEPGMTVSKLLDNIAERRVIQWPITFIEGWTFAQMFGW